MKHRHYGSLAVLFTLAALGLSACQGGGTSSKPPVDTSTPAPVGSSVTPASSEEEDETFQGIVRIHFHNLDRTEANKAIYIWAPGLNGNQFAWTGMDDYGGYYDMDCLAAPWKGHIVDEFSFIIKEPNSWAGQSSDTQVFLASYLSRAETVEGRKRLNVYTAEGNGINIDCFKTAEEALQDNFRTIKANPDWHSFDLRATAAPATDITVYKLTADYYLLAPQGQEMQLENYRLGTFPKPDGKEFSIDINETIDPQADYLFKTNFDSSKPKLIKGRYATMEQLYDTRRFNADYTYAGDDLGMRYYKDHTEFRIWAPTAVLAQVIVYASPNPAALENDIVPGSDTKKKVLTLFRQKHGVHAGAIEGDFEGMGYTFRLYYEGNEVETIDPYVRATGANGKRGAIIDFAKTNPEGWDQVRRPQQKFTELTTYEVHMRDFTADESWTSKKGNKRGTYNAMAEEGTRYADTDVKTGLDSILELGPNAVQLLPVFDQDNEETVVESVDAQGNPILVEPGYNWGYNPQNFNVVEGAYASNPYDPITRIREYKNLIQTFANHNIGTIMDVVYNHVASLSASSMNKVAPMYYFYYNGDSPHDQTGCGNSINTTRVMTSRFVVDSLKWWAEEYKVKGFRFDLMGCLEVETMRAAKDALYEIDPTIVMYGEGWAGVWDAKKAKQSADTYNVYKYLGDNGKGSVGCFNDCVREGLKGETKEHLPTFEGVFINATSPSNDAVWNSETMLIGQNRNMANAGLPTPAQQSVNYIACHDNYTLYDHVNYMLHGFADRARWIDDFADTKEAVIGLYSTVVFSQGMAFINGGDELFRQKILSTSDPLFQEITKVNDDGFPATSDKWVVRNSYKYGDACNSFKWDRKAANIEYFNKLAAAIKARNDRLGTAFGKMDGVVDTDYGCKTTSIGAGIPAIGGYAGTGENAVSMFLAGNVDSVTLDVTAGQYDVIYSSKGTTSVDCSNGKLTLKRFESLLLKGKTN